MGMTYDQFWRQDCALVIPYREAYRLKQEEANRQAWLQGLYIYKALNATPIVVQGFAKKGSKVDPYPDKPYEFSGPKTEQERYDDEMKAKSEKLKNYAKEFMAQFNAKRRENELRKLAENTKNDE